MLEKGWINIHINYYAEVYTCKEKNIFINSNLIVDWIELHYHIYILLYTTTYVGITSLPNLFFFNIYNSKSYYHLNLSRKFHFTTINKMALFFLFWDSYLQGPKKVYSIYGHIILIIGHSDPDLGRDTSFSWDTHICQIWWF